MTKNARRLAGIGFAALALSIPASLPAGPVEMRSSKETKAITIQDSWSLPGIIGAGVKTTDEYTEGNGFLVVPIFSTLGRGGILGGDVLFVEPYSSWGEQGEVAASLGFGFRHLFSSQSVTAVTRPDAHQAGFLEEGVYVGANVFVDMMNTQFDNQFWQLGVGMEAGTRYIEARANYYIPLTDRQLAFEQRSRQTFSSSRSSSRQQVTPVNDPYATGFMIAQDANFSTVTTTKTTTTTIERLFQLFEEGMEGWDAEVALLVPGLDRYMDVKLIGGYYSFDNQPFGPQTGGTGNVEGWKAGLEVRPVPAVVLTATWYEDQRFVGSDWLYGAQLQIPFEMGDLGDGKGFWGRVKDSFSPRRRHLVERLAEPVHRQNEAIKIGNSTEEETEVSTSVKSVTKVVSQGTRQIVLQNDVIFVNNAGPTGNGIQAGSDVTGTGTAEQPFLTIQTGANLAQLASNNTARVWNVYTQGTPGGYTESVSATTGSVNFIGSGRLIPGLGGTSFGTGPAPLLTGGFNAANIQQFGVTAYNVTGGLSTGGADGIRLVNVGRFVIDGNFIAGVGADAVEVRTTGGAVSNGVIVGNSIYLAGDEGIQLDTADTSKLDVVLLNNRFAAGSSDDVDLTSHQTSTLNAYATGNIFVGGSNDAFSVVTLNGSTTNFVGIANQIQDGGDDGFFLEANNTSRLNALITDNSIYNVDDDGVDLDADGTSVISLSVLRNNISYVGGDGVVTLLVGGATGAANISQNNISAVGDEGIEFILTGAAVRLNALVDENTIVSTSSHGIDASTFLGARLNLNASNNTIIASQLNGFDLQAHTLGRITANLNNNFITNTVENGMFLHADLGGQLNVNVVGGTIANAGLNSIYAETEFGSTAVLNLNVTGSTFVNAFLDHIQTFSASSTTLNTMVTGSTFRTNALADGSAIYAVVEGNSNQDITAIGNDMANTNLGVKFSSGIVVEAEDTADVNLVASGNLLTNFAYAPIHVRSADSADVIATVTNNVVNGMVGAPPLSSPAIDFYAVDGGNIDATVTGNSVFGANGNGIAFEIDNGGTINAIVTGNSVRNGLGAGISLITSSAGTLSVTGFDRNSILNVGGDGLLLIEGAGTSVSINGTINTGNNIIDTVGGATVLDVNLSADGTFHLGAPINANRAPNTSVP